MADEKYGRMSEEARSSLDHLIENQNQFSDHSIEVIKINLLVGSLVLTAGSFLANSVGITPIPTKAYISGGVAVLAWLGSILMAELTYFGIRTHIGVSHSAIEYFPDVEIEDIEEVLLRSYSDMLQYSAEENRSTARHIMLSFALTTLSIVAFCLTGIFLT
ncbi:hypothetical protein [Haloarcula sp. 1CSR25-25]|uniref:hypothetical protein n=1 Tax=Haloarcula sp. 1CSR25-25 TaxID=2862545 RepID=UPI0028955FBF|nr:hypothetical protein [Haloarcula sp. 1CSR25-25]MDT3436743.1 hypothetical protein [Haloarcula sp. 1CSR25-25]